MFTVDGTSSYIGWEVREGGVCAVVWGGVYVFLVPDAQERVPGAGGDGHAVLGDAQAWYAVVVAG